MNDGIPIVHSRRKKNRIFWLLQNYDVSGFVKMIKELQEVELSKMKEYGINFFDERLEWEILPLFLEENRCGFSFTLR